VDRRWIDTQTPIVAGAAFWGYPGVEGEEESRDESPDESREKDVVRELFLFGKLFSYVRDCFGSEGGVDVALALLDGGEAALEVTCECDALGGESHGSFKVTGRIARGGPKRFGHCLRCQRSHPNLAGLPCIRRVARGRSLRS